MSADAHIIAQIRTSSSIVCLNAESLSGPGSLLRRCSHQNKEIKTTAGMPMFTCLPGFCYEVSTLTQRVIHFTVTDTKDEILLWLATVHACWCGEVCILYRWITMLWEPRNGIDVTDLMNKLHLVFGVQEHLYALFLISLEK